MDDDGVSVQLDERSAIERVDEQRLDPPEQRKKIVIADVAGRHEHQTFRQPNEEMAVEEVVILADHDAALLIGQACDLGVGGLVAISETDRVNDIVPELGEEFSQPERKVGVR